MRRLPSPRLSRPPCCFGSVALVRTSGKQSLGLHLVRPLIVQGAAVAVSADGGTVIVGGYVDSCETWVVWVFMRTADDWTKQGPKLVGTGTAGPNAHQGSSVALSSEGNTVVIGGSGDGEPPIVPVWIFMRSESGWTQDRPELVGTGALRGSHQGSSVAIPVNGDTAMVGGCGDNEVAGAAWACTRGQQPAAAVPMPRIGLTGLLALSAMLAVPGYTAPRHHWSQAPLAALLTRLHSATSGFPERHIGLQGMSRSPCNDSQGGRIHNRSVCS